MGLGGEIIDEYFTAGLVHDIADIYDLRVEQLWGEERNKLVSAQKIIRAIDESKQIPFERVVFALGIRFVGETSAKALARYFKTMDALMNASADELCHVDGIGDVIAASIVNYFHEEGNREIIERLRAKGLQFALSEKQLSSRSNVLENKSIVISGVFARHSRDEYKRMIELNGGKNVSSISKSTSFILAGDNMGPSKLEKAQKLGIALMNENEFLAMLPDNIDVQDNKDNNEREQVVQNKPVEGSLF